MSEFGLIPLLCTARATQNATRGSRVHRQIARTQTPQKLYQEPLGLSAQCFRLQYFAYSFARSQSRARQPSVGHVEVATIATVRSTRCSQWKRPLNSAPGYGTVH